LKCINASSVNVIVVSSLSSSRVAWIIYKGLGGGEKRRGEEGEEGGRGEMGAYINASCVDDIVTPSSCTHQELLG
jgi:hypothetical protein